MTIAALEPYANIIKVLFETGRTHAETSTTLQQTALKLASDRQLLIGIFQSTLKVAYVVQSFSSQLMDVNM